MSDTEDNNAPEEVTAEQRRQREAMGALDRADEGATLDDSAAKNAMSALGAPKKTNEAEAARKKALAEVQISLDDVAIIMKEMEVSRAAAELALRENKGSLEAALRALIDA